MVGITGIVWNSESRGREIVKSILFQQLRFYYVHQAHVGQSEFGNHRQGQEGQDGKWSWRQLAPLLHIGIRLRQRGQGKASRR
jgi:hypothetical protein